MPLIGRRARGRGAGRSPRAPRRPRRGRSARGRRSPRCVARSSASRGRAEGDLAAVQAEHEVEAARALDVVARHEQRPALAAQLGEERRRSAGRSPGRRPPAARRAAARARPARARAPAARAGAGRPRARRRACPPVRREPDALERRARRGAVGAARRQPPAPVRERAHQRDVERAHREVEPRALGLRHVGGPAAQRDAARERLELAEQGAEERGLAAPVRAQHADGLARVDRERDIARAPAGRRSRRTGPRSSTARPSRGSRARQSRARPVPSASTA